MATMQWVTVAQLISIFGIFVLTLICVLLPLKLMPRGSALRTTSSSSGHILSLCNCFSAGVFLGTCFLMLVPFVEEKFLEVLTAYTFGPDWVAWVSQLSIMGGLFLSIFLEQAVNTYRERQNSKQSRSATADKVAVELKGEYTDIPLTSQTDSDESEDESRDWEKKRMIRRKLRRCRASKRAHKGSGDTECGNIDGSPARSSGSNPPKSEPASNNISDQIQMKHMASNNTEQAGEKCNSFNVNGAHEGHSHDTGNGGHGHSHMVDLLQENFGVRCLLLFLALSVHSVFEGVAVGLQEDLYKLLALLVGVVIHEVLMAFAMGVSLSQQHISTSTFMKLGLVYSATIPVGIGVGMGLRGIQTVAGMVVSAVTQGITAGTFLYVIFIEILPTEINQPHHRLLKVAVMFLGVVLIGSLQFLPHGH